MDTAGLHINAASYNGPTRVVHNLNLSASMIAWVYLPNFTTRTALFEGVLLPLVDTAEGHWEAFRHMREFDLQPQGSGHLTLTGMPVAAVSAEQWLLQLPTLRELAVEASQLGKTTYEWSSSSLEARSVGNGRCNGLTKEGRSHHTTQYG